MNLKLKGFISLALGLFFLQWGISQNSNEAKNISATYLIENVFVIAQPGTPPNFTSVLIKDGLIDQIGPNIQVPYNAQIIKADSMYIYAGFIDMASHTAIEMPKKDEDRPEIKDPNFPPNGYVGINPERKASDFIATNDGSIKELRAAGFTVSHILPKGDFLPGSGTIILLSGQEKERIILRDNTSKYFNFENASRSYPATKIGIMAKWRELLTQAANAKKHQSLFQTNTSVNRPAYSDAVISLIDVVDKKQPVFLQTTKVLDIHRALQLKKELNFDLVLTDVQQVLHALDIIKSSNTPVLLSIKLPKNEKAEKEKKELEEKKKKEEKEKKEKEKEKDPTETEPEEKELPKPSKAKKEEKKDPETLHLEMRKQKAIEEYESQAALLSKKGIPFGFSFIDGKAKNVHENIRRMISAGLGEDAALAALTTTPAKMLKMEKLIGTVEKGKIGNLLICDKPYFEEKSKIKYVFVDGQPFKFEEKKKKKKKEGTSDDIVGQWDYTTDIPMPNNTGKIIIRKKDDTYHISIASVDDLTDFEEISDVTLDDNNMVFEFNIDNDGTSMKISMDWTFDGDTFEGTLVAGQFGTFNITGERTSPSPEND